MFASIEVFMALVTPLHDLHAARGARFGEFAGYDMPMRYEDGAVAEHNWTRTAVSLFDVSHMGVVRLTGDDAAVALETIVPSSITPVAEGRGRYTFLTNESGGVIDDLIVTNRGDHLQLVLNAGTKHNDLDHIRRHIGDRCEISDLQPMAILALQGPQAASVLSEHRSDVAELTFGFGAEVEIGGVKAFASRSGYTGEDGFELIVPADGAAAFAEMLLQEERIKLAGLAARDSLRLEAGLCLYGHDLSEEISPIEAGLTWAIQKKRREEGGFLGDTVILDQISNGVTRQRVGIQSKKRPVREGSTLHDENGREIGFVSSGGFGPTVEAPVAMGFVEPAFVEVGTQITAHQRGKEVAMTVASLPFAPHRYYRG
jgi:aminomethyltransferase